MEMGKFLSIKRSEGVILIVFFLFQGNCLGNFSVKAGDSRDSYGRGRFFSAVPEQYLIQPKPTNYWFWKYVYYPVREVTQY